MLCWHNQVCGSFICATVSANIVPAMKQEAPSNYEQMFRANLIKFAAMLFQRMHQKYGGGTTLNELVLLNYGFLCHSRGETIGVTKAARDLGMSKSTVSRIVTGMRAKGFVKEIEHPTDGRCRVFTLADTYLDRGDDDIQKFLAWCAQKENRMA